MGENLDIVAQGLGVWSPDELHFLVVHSLVLVLVVESGEEPGIEAHFSEESSVGVGVTEWIDLPADSWFDTDGLKNPFMTNHHVVDHILIYWASFVVH